MKFFISSRMQELFFERKIVIEAIHSAGHTPLYIETEPDVKDKEARETMDRLAADADGFILLVYLSKGKPERILNNITPIEYELEQFRKKHKKNKEAPIIIFKKTPDEYVHASVYLINWVKELGIPPIEFEKPGELEHKIEKELKGFEKHKDSPNTKSKFIIRYIGPDFVGLIQKLSEIVFTRYGLNIDYISHASSGGSATTYVSCSYRVLKGKKLDPDRHKLSDLEDEVKKDLENDFKKARREGRYIDGSGSNRAISVNVRKHTVEPPPYQFFTIVRTIDAPGQVNAICKELRAKCFNIDEFLLRPSPPEHSKQTTMSMWLSKAKTKSGEQDDDLKELERVFRYLVGVRNFEIRVMDSPAPSKLRRNFQD